MTDAIGPVCCCGHLAAMHHQGRACWVCACAHFLERVESTAYLRPLPPLAPHEARDPYDGLPVDAERLYTHAPDDVCRFAAPHPRALCRHVHPVGAAHPVTAAELAEVPAVLQEREPPAPWETEIRSGASRPDDRKGADRVPSGAPGQH
jgi:hypothetical protein